MEDFEDSVWYKLFNPGSRAHVKDPSFSVGVLPVIVFLLSCPATDVPVILPYRDAHARSIATCIGHLKLRY